MHKNTLILPALWTPTMQNTVARESAFAVKQTVTAVDTRRPMQADAPAVIFAQVLCAWTAFAAAWVAVKL